MRAGIQNKPFKRLNIPGGQERSDIDVVLFPHETAAPPFVTQRTNPANNPTNCGAVRSHENDSRLAMAPIGCRQKFKEAVNDRFQISLVKTA
jgi:hypothetical protein